jgi:hypothetical protein
VFVLRAVVSLWAGIVAWAAFLPVQNEWLGCEALLGVSTLCWLAPSFGAAALTVPVVWFFSRPMESGQTPRAGGMSSASRVGIAATLALVAAIAVFPVYGVTDGCGSLFLRVPCQQWITPLLSTLVGLGSLWVLGRVSRRSVSEDPS